jgi:hypothetical protein
VVEAAEEGAPERALIAVGSRGLGAVHRLWVESVSTKVLRVSKEPLLIVHRDRRETRGGIGPAAGLEIRRGPVLESVDARPSPTTSRWTSYPSSAGAPGFSRRSGPKVDMVLATGLSRSAQHPSTLDVAGSRL